MPLAQAFLTPRRVRLGPAVAVATLHLAGCALFMAAIAGGGAQALPTALGLTAYLLGVRHAFDADHIVAIDNTARYLRAQDRPAGSVGFWFSLGHSTVVFLACVLLGSGWQSLADQVSGTSTAGATIAGLWGPAVSGTFLVALGLLNARIVVALWRNRRDPAAAAHGLAARGFVSGALGRRWTIERPGQMLAVGFLFGLGFDTVTSVGLLLLAAGGQQAALPWVAFVALPLLFAAGMTLFDSIDSVAMNRAYRWADSDARRFHYNLTVTAISAFAALAIGWLTLASLIGRLA